MTTNLLLLPVAPASTAPTLPTAEVESADGFAMALEAVLPLGSPPGPEPPPLALMAEEGVAIQQPNAETPTLDFLPPSDEASMISPGAPETAERPEVEARPLDATTALVMIAASVGTQFAPMPVVVPPLATSAKEPVAIASPAPVLPTVAPQSPDVVTPAKLVETPISESTFDVPVTPSAPMPLGSDPVKAEPLTAESPEPARAEFISPERTPSEAPAPTAVTTPRDLPLQKVAPTVATPPVSPMSTPVPAPNSVQEIIATAPSDVKIAVEASPASVGPRPIVNEKVAAKPESTTLEVGPAEAVAPTAPTPARAATSQQGTSPQANTEADGEETTTLEPKLVTKVESQPTVRETPLRTESVRPTEAPARAELTSIDRVQLVRQVADRVEMLAAIRPKDGVTVHLEPADLGRITVLVKSLGNQIDASIDSSNEQVRTALEQARPHLMFSLEQRGMQVNSLNFGSTPSYDAQSGFGSSAWQQQGNPQGQPGNPSQPTFGGASREPKSSVAVPTASQDKGVNLWL